MSPISFAQFTPAEQLTSLDSFDSSMTLISDRRNDPWNMRNGDETFTVAIQGERAYFYYNSQLIGNKQGYSLNDAKQLIA